VLTQGAVSHISVAGLVLLVGVDRFMSKIRAITNVCGNAVAMIVVAEWAGAILLEPTVVARPELGVAD
jgi:aerobic C4-dicarboxylate transport protein